MQKITALALTRGSTTLITMSARRKADAHTDGKPPSVVYSHQQKKTALALRS